MLLAVDSSGGTGVALLGDDGTTVGEWRSADARAHAEVIGPFLEAAVAAAGGPHTISAVAYGTGPGPFTGLRVGMAAARAVAQALGVPTLPVVSHDAIAQQAVVQDAGPAGRFVVTTDAKRRERYFTVYEFVALDGNATSIPTRIGQPRVGSPDELPELPAVDAPVSAAALGRVALARIRLGMPADAPSPLYLRAPDVTPSSPKRVRQ